MQVSGHLPHLHVFKVETETSSPRFNNTCLCLARGDTAHRKHPEASQQPEMVEFVPRLHLQRWTAAARDVRVDAFFDVLTSCVPLTAHASPAHSWSGFLRAWSKVGPSKGRRIGAANRCFGHMRTLKSEKPRRPIAQPPPSWT